MRQAGVAVTFIIITHARLEGVFLSRPGHFGNLPFADDAAAVTHARSVAGSTPMAIDRKVIGRRNIPR